MLGNLFKKSPTFTPAMQELFVKISFALPQRFHFLQKQLRHKPIFPTAGDSPPYGQGFSLYIF